MFAEQLERLLDWQQAFIGEHLNERLDDAMGRLRKVWFDPAKIEIARRDHFAVHENLLHGPAPILDIGRHRTARGAQNLSGVSAAAARRAQSVAVAVDGEIVRLALD